MPIKGFRWTICPYDLTGRAKRRNFLVPSGLERLLGFVSPPLSI